MYNWFKKVNKKKLILGIVICLVLFWFLGTFIGDHQVFAQGTLGIGSTAPEGQGGPTDRTGDSSGSSTIARFLTWVVYGLVWIAGKLLMIMISILMGVVNFNDFVNARAVAIGWVMVRDLSNIFFVFVMLLIAFGTLFNIQTYEYKKLLPKLIIAVVLVNFSKMIVGLFIDFGQVIMLTFVNAFKDVAAGAIVNGLGLERMFELRDMLKNTEGVDINDWSIFGSTVLAFIMLTIAAVVILTMIVVLLFRIIMLWVLVIFSPFAFVASLIPNNPLQKVSMFAQYWGNLSKYIIVGPILAFFLWLSFSILAIVNVDRDQHVIALYRLQNLEEQGGSRTSEEKKELIEYMASKVSSPQNMFDFMVTIALLIGSLTITQQMGVMGGAMGMQAVRKMRQLGIKALVGGLERATIGKKGKDGERTGGLWGLTKYGDSHLWAATGFSPLRTPKKFYQGLKDQAKRKKEERELKGDIKAGKQLKAGGVESLILGAGAGRDYAEAFAAGGFLNRKGFGRMSAMLKGGPVEWDKIEGEIKAERQKIALLKLEKEKGDPLKVYDNDLREKIEDNTRDKTDKEKERDNMPKVAERMRDEYKKAEREGKEEAPALKKEFEDFMAAAPAREKELNEEILDHNVEIQKASSLLDEDDETRRGKAEDKYKQEAKQKKDDAQNLKEGKLTEAEVKMKSGELNDLNDALIKIHRDLKDASDKKDHVLIGQLKEQEKKTTDKIQELKQVFATDKDGEFTKNKEGHYQLRDDYRITDEEQLESRGQEAKRLEQEAEVYERIATGKGRSDEKIDEAIKAASQTITDMKGGQAKYAAPQTFYADQARRQLVEEESKKITSENWHEQLAAIQDAMLSKDWAKFEANFKAAARNGNENEVMDQLGFVNEYRGEEELKEPGTGGGSDAFRKYYLMKNLGMDDESSKAMMDDVGYIGEGIGHWSMSHAHTLKGGRRVNQSWEDQQDEVYAEQSKVDGRRLFRTYNRLAWGGEVPQMDGTRRFQFSPYALRRWLTSYQSIYDGHIKNNEFSKSQAEHFVNPVAMAQLEATAKLLPTKKEQDQFRWVLEKLKRYAATLPKGKEKSFNTSNIIANVDFRHQF